VRYSIYWTQINLVSSLNDCNNVNPNFSTTFPTGSALIAATTAGVVGAAYPGFNAAAGINPIPGQANCDVLNGGPSNVASLPVREELSFGGYLTSLAGYGLTYNTLDNNKRPTSGVLLSFGQDIAGLGGDAKYLRTVVDFRSYYEVVSDLVGIMHLQGGDMFGLTKGPNGESNYVRMLDDFKMGPNLVRGFQPAGLGPRDLTPGTSGDALGGTYYWGASLEVQYPFYFLPKDAGFRGAVFVDSGAEWGYKGETSWPSNGEINGTITTSTGASYFCGNCALQFADTAAPRVSVGASLIWDSPFGPLRFDFAYPILKQPYDRVRGSSSAAVRGSDRASRSAPGSVSRFRSSQGLAARSDANFGIKGTPADYDASAVFGFEVPNPNLPLGVRNFKSSALVLCRISSHLTAS
jgi:outer membrane protein insertion porin family